MAGHLPLEAEGLEYVEIACRIGCGPSVVSREVARHGGRESYRSHRADQAAVAARSRPKRLKVGRVPRRSAYVRYWLHRGWSPASIAGRLPADIADEQDVRASHEALYAWIYAQPVSTLDRELIELRSGRTAPEVRAAHTAGTTHRRTLLDRGRPGRGRGVCRSGPLEGRPRHREYGRSAVATLVERTGRFLILVPLAGRDALAVSQAIIAMAGQLPAPMKRSLTWDCGAEMARHSEKGGAA